MLTPEKILTNGITETRLFIPCDKIAIEVISAKKNKAELLFKIISDRWEDVFRVNLELKEKEAFSLGDLTMFFPVKDMKEKSYSTW